MLRPHTQVAGVERFDHGQRDLLVLLHRHKKKPPSAPVGGELTNAHALHDGTDRRVPHPRRPYSPECVEVEFCELLRLSEILGSSHSRIMHSIMHSLV